METEKNIICTICPKSCRIKVVVSEKGDIISTTGHMCKRGLSYSNAEAIDPKRTLTTTVAVDYADYAVVSVKTDKPVPKKLIFACMDIIKNTKAATPVRSGDIIIRNILDTGADVVITRDIGEDILK
jgi:CxxC motif-containing protein